MRVSTSTKASMLACGSCRPRIHTTSVRDGSTVSGQPPRPEEPEQPKMGLFQTPVRPRMNQSRAPPTVRADKWLRPEGPSDAPVLTCQQFDEALPPGLEHGLLELHWRVCPVD